MNLTIGESGDDGRMVPQDGEPPVSARHLDHLNVAAEDDSLGRDDLQIEWRIHVLECLELGVGGLFEESFSLFDGLLDCSDEVESGLGIFIEFAVHNHVEALDGVLDGDVGTL